VTVTNSGAIDRLLTEYCTELLQVERAITQITRLVENFPRPIFLDLLIGQNQLTYLTLYTFPVHNLEQAENFVETAIMYTSMHHITRGYEVHCVMQTGDVSTKRQDARPLGCVTMPRI
jgi:hypothetical protein